MYEHYETLSILHPATPFRGQPVENVFVACDSMNTQYGVGAVMYQYQPDFFPDAPHQFFLQLESQPAAQYMLLGALLGRAHQLWAQAQPQAPARVYAAVHPRDTATLNFYAANGFDPTPAFRGVRLEIPATSVSEQMSMDVQRMTLHTPQEQAELISRLQSNGIVDFQRSYLEQVMRLPNFLHLGLFHRDHTHNNSAQLVGEVILSGEDSNAEVLALYVLPAFRRQGLGRFLLHRAMNVAASEGVSAVYMKLLTNSLPQQHLAAAFNAATLADWTIYPSLILR